MRLVKRVFGMVMLAGAGLPLYCGAQPEAQQLQVLRKALQARPVLEAPSAREAAPSAAATPSPSLRAGVLYQVPVARDEERQIDRLVVQRVRPSAPAAPVVPLPGVTSQLAKDGREVKLKAFVLPGQPLTYQRELGLFEGSIRVGIADVFEQSEGRPLSAPVTFQVIETGMAQPDLVELARTSPPHETIRVRVPSPAASVTVHIASRFDPKGTAVVLPVQPTLLVYPDRAEIEGYGLDTTRLNVATYGLPRPGGRVVQLRAKPSAFIEPSQVTLSAQGTAQALLRSDAAGSVTVTASAAGLDSGTTALEFLTPTRTLLAGIVGGLLGGFLRLVPAMRRGLSASRLLLGFLTAVASGLLVVALYAIGVNVLPVEPKVSVGTVVVLAVAALGAWFGTALLRNLKNV